MLIGIDASRANRKFKNGTEWYSFYLIRELAKIDSKNQYILYSDQPLEAGLCDLTAENENADCKMIISKAGYQTIKSPHKNFKAKILKWPLVYLWTQIRMSLEMLFAPPDLLFIPAHTLPIIHPQKSIITIHDIGFEREREVYGSNQIIPGAWSGKIFDFMAKLFTRGKFHSNVIDYHKWSTKFALKHARKIIAVSGFTKQEMMQVYQSDGSKIKVVYNGLNYASTKADLDPNKIEQVLNKYGITDPYIFYIGRLEKKKNTARLVAAYAIMKEKHKDIKQKLVLAGSAGLGYDQVNDVINEFDLFSDVIMTGWIPGADVPYLYGGASLFIFPSLYEGFGIPLLEAMLSGAPIAASNIASIPEVVKDAALLFNPRDEYDMAEKMAKILLDKQLADKLINNGFARIKDFSLAKCARETLAVFE